MTSKVHIVADIELNKILRAFDTREEAINYVERLLKTNGDDYVEELAISRQTDEGRIVDVVTGPELLALVRETGPSRDLVTASGSSYGGGPHGSEGSGRSHESMAAKSFK